MIARLGGRRRKPKSELRSGIYAALDAGSSKTACVIAQVEPDKDGGRPRARILGAGFQQSAGIRGGQIVELEAAEACIRQVVRKAETLADIQIDGVWVAVNCGKPESRIVRAETPLPSGEAGEADVRRVHALSRSAFDASDKENGRDVIYAAPLGYAIDQAAGVRDPRGMFGERLGVSLHMLSAASAPLHNLEVCIERCHLEVEGKALAAHAAGLSCLHEEEIEYGATVIDLGGGTTSIAAFSEGKLVHGCVLPVGGKHITNDIVRGLSAPFREAERLKTLYGNALPVPGAHGQMLHITQIGDDDAEGGKIPREELISIIQPRIDEIFELIAQNLAEARIHNRLIVLTGGGAELTGLQEYAARTLNARVRIGRPLRADALPAAAASPAFSAVTGLLALALDDAAREHNLAPDIQRARKAPSLGRVGAWLKETFL